VDVDTLVDIFRHMLYIVLLTVSIIVIPGLLVGLIISIFQAATQINEIALTFLSKLFIMIAVFSFLSPWLFNLLIGYTEGLFLDITSIIR
jgi:flagellar biosynthesis protein FliQ